jgi:hypothetical protein
VLTVLDVASVAGDRAKQNDDAVGAAGPWAWVIDGATDLYDPPHMPAASDAAWIAHGLNGFLHAMAANHEDGATLLAAGAQALMAQFRPRGDLPAGWGRPAASVALVRETPDGCVLWDLGDCRLFAVDGTGAVFSAGGPQEAAARETEKVRALVGENAAKPLDRADVIDALRASHATRNTPGGWWVFGPDPACAAYARRHVLSLARPAHLLLATDGFSALADRYEVFDAASLVEAGRDQGLAGLVQTLRGIEDADAAGSRHPRFKKSDDATALLLRLS